MSCPELSVSCDAHSVCVAGTGTGTQRKDEAMMSSLQRRMNDSQTSMDSSQGSESMRVQLDSSAGFGMHNHSDTDLAGLQKRPQGPSSVQSDMTDEGSLSRVPGWPAAGWKGRMSSMLLRGPLTSPKSETIKAKKVPQFSHNQPYQKLVPKRAAVKHAVASADLLWG